jgi:ATP-binding cassette, subfamily B, bacterial CvaB/MchF/RaxB
LTSFNITLSNLLNIKVHQRRLAESTSKVKTDELSDSILSYLKFFGDIELSGISYSIDNGRRKLLHNFSTKVQRGSFVHVSGPTGVGKTTLLKIILNIIQPEEGDVRVDGQLLDSYSQQMTRNSFGVVLQEDTLFNGSIISNITAFDPRVDIEQVYDCCKICEIHNDILNLPLGYQSLVGDMGTGLSSGQQQRLLLARALYKSPSILILDEATANLNSDIEHKILSNISALKKTIIFASHSVLVPEFSDLEWKIQPSGIVIEDRNVSKTFGAVERSD